MSTLDEKQLRLITSWMRLAKEQESYTQFIALWIAFNAYCYAYYGDTAERPRADVTNGAGLAGVTTSPLCITARLQRQERRITIDLDTPTKVRIRITDRYTEDNIYAAFAQHHAATYARLREDQTFVAALQTLQQSLERQSGRYYVINMLKVGQHRPERSFTEMVADRTIIPFQDTTSLSRLKDVLYQIRCNIFHGEKVPFVVNDDRIVNAATPVLRSLLETLMKQEPQAQ